MEEFLFLHSTQVTQLVETEASLCSKETLSNICLHWEALVISEEAEQDLQLYIEDTKISPSEWLSKNIKRIAPSSISETIMSYF